MYTLFILVFVAIVLETSAMTYMQTIRQSSNADFLRTRDESLRKLDAFRSDQIRNIIHGTNILRTIPNRLHQMRIQYYLKEDRYSHRALNSFCGKCLKDMWDNRKSSMTCISVSEKFIREALFSLFQRTFDLEFGSKEKQCEHQKELKRCTDHPCVDSVVFRSEEETKQVRNETSEIERIANDLIEKISIDSNACMQGYIQGFEHSNSSCDDNPEQVDDPNRHDFYPHNDSKMEM